MKTITYPASLSKDVDGRWLIKFPDFGWGATDGATRQEALTEAIDLLDELISCTIHDETTLPVPTPQPGLVPVASTVNYNEVFAHCQKK